MIFVSHPFSLSQLTQSVVRCIYIYRYMLGHSVHLSAATASTGLPIAVASADTQMPHTIPFAFGLDLFVLVH